MKALAALLLTAALAGCGGSSSSSGDGADDDAAAGTISGIVIDAVNGAPLNEVDVSVVDEPTVSALTDGDGRFALALADASGPVDLSFARDDYREETYANATEGGLPAPGEIALVPVDNAGVGGLAGRIDDADGNPLVGASIRFLPGINTRTGEAVASTTTGADGSWQVVDLDYGNYTCIILVDGADPVYEIVQVFGGVDRTEQNVTLGRTASSSPSQASTNFSPVFPPEQDRDAFIGGQSNWSVPGHGWSADAGAYTVKRDEGVGLLALSVEFGQVASRRDPWANSRLTLEHSFVGSGSYRVVDSAEKLRAAARAGDGAVLVKFRASNDIDLLRTFVVRYDGVEGASSSTLIASVDELGRYHFSTDTPIRIRKDESLGGREPADALNELDLIVTDAFVP